MKVSTMRTVDRWLGVPVCFALTVFRRIADCLRRSRPERIGSILFVKLAEQGSTVLAWSALREAVRRVGKANVYFLAFEENRAIMDIMEIIPQENVVTIPTRGFWALAAGTVSAVRRLRKKRITAALDLEFFARSSAALSYLSRAPVRVGFHSYAGEAPYRGDLMTHRLSFNTHLHTTGVFRMLVQALDAPPERLPALDLTPAEIADSPAPFQPSDDQMQQVRDILRKETGRQEIPPLILLNANCSDLLPIRTWPAERYVQLARRLLATYPDICVAFTGAPGEAEPVERLVCQVQSDRCISLAGKTTLRQLLVTYTLAEVMVTNDSGPAHFATLTPMDVVTLFGPETPRLFAAQSPRNHVLWAGIACSPCVNAFNNRLSSCRDNICMKKISVDQVFQKVCEVYEERLTIVD